MSKILLAAAALTTQAWALQDSCTALVLSGGGANGAWEAGALYAMLHEGNPSDFEYDVVTGVSVGSINALLFVG